MSEIRNDAALYGLEVSFNEVSNVRLDQTPLLMNNRYMSAKMDLNMENKSYDGYVIQAIYSENNGIDSRVWRAKAAESKRKIALYSENMELERNLCLENGCILLYFDYVVKGASNPKRARELYCYMYDRQSGDYVQTYRTTDLNAEATFREYAR